MKTTGRSLRALLTLLADGALHSGSQLATQLNISRSAVWKLVHALRSLGIDVHTVSRQGYHLPAAVELYDAARINAHIPQPAQHNITRLDILLAVDSTNRFAKDHIPTEHNQTAVCVAEVQHAGRGRRGRSWLAPFGSGICLSMTWTFTETPPTFSALSLAVGVALVRVLHQYGGTEVRLKWPNDLLVQGRKLGGILIEMSGEATGPAQVIIGIGLNLQLPVTTRQQLAEQAIAVTDLQDVLGPRTPSRNQLVGTLLTELLQTLQLFAQQGFAPFKTAWLQFDALANQPVQVLTQHTTVYGIARGVAADGALLLENNNQQQQYYSGEISLRVSS